MKEPISWSIKIEPVDAGYLLDYVESFPNDEKHLHAVQLTKDLMSRHPFFVNNNVEITEKGENIEVHFKYIGKKQTIIDMMAGEFLSFSTFGKRSLQEIFARHSIEMVLK